MKNNDLIPIWFHVPVILIKIVRILTKKPSGKPKTIELEILGKSIRVATDPQVGRVRLEVISLPVLNLEDKKVKPEEDYQPELDLGEEDWYWIHCSGIFWFQKFYKYHNYFILFLKNGIRISTNMTFHQNLQDLYKTNGGIIVAKMKLKEELFSKDRI